jgi:predicted AAA+ superfamily ATPase
MDARYLKNSIRQDLNEKMVFLGGPRQVGKTTLAFHFLNGDEKHPAYFTWDSLKSRQALLKEELPANQKLIVLDEIHKYRNWRNLVKGLYDTNKSSRQFLVTGSARLDYYRRGGDSLQGRYHYYRLHPFSLYEINRKPTASDLDHLLKFGGFPEPFFKAHSKQWKRWQNERITRVIQEDLISLEQMRDVSSLQLLIDALPARVGAPLSVNNLREDLGVSFEAVERWITVLENLYFCFRILPYGPPKIRAAKKEKKLYLWDWSLCEDAGKRFENLVASQLLKYCHFHEDTEGDKMELRFFRDVYKREIDFVVLKNAKPQFAVECKVGDKALSPHISYFLPRTTIPLFYQVHTQTKDVEIAGGRVRILPLTTLARELKI